MRFPKFLLSPKIHFLRFLKFPLRQFYAPSCGYSDILARLLRNPAPTPPGSEQEKTQRPSEYIRRRHKNIPNAYRMQRAPEAYIRRPTDEGKVSFPSAAVREYKQSERTTQEGESNTRISEEEGVSKNKNST